MRVTDQPMTPGLTVDELYERFFDGYYNLGRPGEIFERSVVVSRPRAQDVKARPGAATRRVRRSKRSARRRAAVK